MNNPTFSPNTDPTLRRMDRIIELFILIGILSFTSLVCCSCGTSKHVTQLVEHTSIDTVYLSNIQYDSIYIYQDKFVDRSRDTLYIKDVSIEYRYKLLKDTIRVVERDSIPYEVTITQVKEITRPLTWYDHLSRAILWLNIGFVVLLIIRLLRKLKA